MKCVLFCCLMVFCAFETTLSDDSIVIRLDELRTEASQKLYSISQSLMNLIMDDVEVAKSNGISAQECYDNANASMKKYADVGYKQLDSCYEVAVQKKNIAFANRCNNQTISTFEEEANKLRPNVKTCIRSNTPIINM